MPRSGRSSSSGDDELRIRLGRSGGGRDGAPRNPSARLTKLLAAQRSRLFSRTKTAFDGGGDRRQRVVVKASFHAHRGGAGGGRAGGGLAAHAGYLERDGAGKDGAPGQFYDLEHDVAEDARARMQEWAQEDPRHFRLMLAPERGDLLPDQREFTREVMSQMERELGVELDWVAVDHHNTDNPHTHVILRGVRGDGVDLVIPRAYISHGLREASREIATLHIGERTPADDRLRLEREIAARGWTRLDQGIEKELGPDRAVRLQALETDALRARVRELERMGLAEETKRNELRFAEDWRERLEAQGPIDVKRELTHGRVYEPRMGRLEGVVERAGPRGEHGERGVLVIDTAEHGRVLLNTSRDAVDGLSRGDLVALAPDGRRASVERMSDQPVQDQVRAPEYTDLDRGL
ncbi:MAG: relaxase/mobilization nuclease domain-containing protein, partial [Caulobacterales bacterium]